MSFSRKANSLLQLRGTIPTGSGIEKGGARCIVPQRGGALGLARGAQQAAPLQRRADRKQRGRLPLQRRADRNNAQTGSYKNGSRRPATTAAVRVVGGGGGAEAGEQVRGEVTTVLFDLIGPQAALLFGHLY